MGQSVQRLAEIFGIKVPLWAKVLIAEVGGVERRVGRSWRANLLPLTLAATWVQVDIIGKEEPLSEEKLW